MKQLSPRIREVGSFGVVIVIAYVVYLFLYYVGTRLVHIPLPEPVILVGSMALADVVNYALNRLWTFKATDQPINRQVGRYILVAGSSLALQFLGFVIGRRLGIHDLVLAIFLPVSRAIYNYFLHRAFTFKKTNEATPL